MKKLLLMAAIAVFGFTTVSAQGPIKVGVNAGIPVGDLDEFSSFNVGVDIAYLFNVADGVDVGPLLGYSHFFGKDFEFLGVTIPGEDIQFLPIAGSGRIALGEAFFLGADLGYAVGINDGNDGGFFYRPKVGYSFGMAAIIVSYSGVSTDGATANSINAGVEFGF